MNMRRTMMMVAVAVILGEPVALSAHAAVSVTEVKAAQRYPWNGMVDIDYTVVCDDANADVYVFPEGTDNDTGALLQLKTLTGEGANGAVKAGTHRMTWNAAKDMPNFHTTSFSVKMTAISGAAPYIVIDLSGGANAASYPVRFSAAGPNLDDDTCRTTELWLRLILPGTFQMGSPTTELGRSSNETQHSVTISKPFYMGIYETTCRQYFLVTGHHGDYNYYDAYYDNRAVGASFRDLRGSELGLSFPNNKQVDPDSFFGRLRMRTSLSVDLPTEAQWEYACRAGTTNALNNNLNLSDAIECPELDQVGRYYYNMNGNDTWRKVGKFPPNKWGLFDMHGNLLEYCLDWYVNDLGVEHVTDPVGPVSGVERVARGGGAYGWDGGHYMSRASECRSAYRLGVDIDDYGYGGFRPREDIGFRVVCMPE